MKKAISIILVVLLMFSTVASVNASEVKNIFSESEDVSEYVADDLPEDLEDSQTDTQPAQAPPRGASSGTEGTCSWSIDNEGVLTIWPTDGVEGTMTSTMFTQYGWNEHRSAITSIEIKDGVTNIGYDAFYNCVNLTDVEISNSVTLVDSCAFQECSALTDIEIPDAVKTIGECAFDNCISLESVTFPDGLETIGIGAFYGCNYINGELVIPGSVISIGVEAFYGCNDLDSLVIEAGAEGVERTIGNYAFYDCADLDSVEINSGVISIGEEAFSGCGDISDLTLPSTLETIGSYAFYECGNLINLVIPGSVEIIGDSAFDSCSNLVRVVIQDGVTSIGTAAFSNCEYLTALTLPGSLQEIQNDAFANCTGLTRLTIPGSVKTIDSCAFSGCTNLARLDILEGVETIGNEAFYDCNSIENVTIPASVTEIGSDAFCSCDNLETITVLNSNADIGTDALDCNIIRGYEGSTAEEYADGNEITFIPIPYIVKGTKGEYDYALTEDGVLIISPSNGVSGSMGTSPYPWNDYKDYIKEVVIEDGITDIGANAFSSCYYLTDVSIPDSVTKIGNYAFLYSDSLKSITIPQSVTSIGNSVFSLSVDYEGTVIKGYTGSAAQTYANTNNIPFMPLDSLPITGTSGGCTYTIDANGVLTIRPTNGSSGAMGNSNYPWSIYSNFITKIVIANGVTNIGDNAFEDFSSLSSATIPGTVNTIGERAFADCTNLVTVMGTLPDEENIGEDAFLNTPYSLSVQFTQSSEDFVHEAPDLSDYDACEEGYNNDAGNNWIYKSTRWIDQNKTLAELRIDIGSVKKNIKNTDFIFVLDYSGSMAGEPEQQLETVVTGMMYGLLSDSANNNRVAVAPFESSERMAAIPFSDDAASTSTAMKALTADGGTNYADGLNLALSLIAGRTGEEAKRNTLILFFSDGEPGGEPGDDGVQEAQALKNMGYPIAGVCLSGGTVNTAAIEAVSSPNMAFEATNLDELADTMLRALNSLANGYLFTDVINEEYFTIDTLSDITIVDSNNAPADSALTLGEDGKTITVDMDMLDRNENYTIIIPLEAVEDAEGDLYTNDGEAYMTVKETGEQDNACDSPCQERDLVSLTVDPNGGIWNSYQESISYSLAVGATMTIPNPTRVGYSFNGWTWTIQGGATLSGTTVTMGTSDATLKANWVANHYIITLNPNGADEADGTTTLYTIFNTGVYTDSSRTKSMTTTANPITLPQRAGYVFTGYYSSTDANATQYIDATGKITTAGLNVGKGYSNNNSVWYAHWTNAEYTVTYDYSENGGNTSTVSTAKVYSGDAIDLSPTATKTDWTFVGWNTNKSATTALDSLTMGTSDVTLYAIYSKDLTGTFKYYNNQSKNVSVTIYNKSTSGSITTPAALGAPSGYTFKGWSTSDSAKPTSLTAANTSITISADTTYYASYSYTITITFSANGGTGTAPLSSSGTGYMNYVGTKVGISKQIPSNTFTKSGYTFATWNAKTDGSGKNFTVGSSYTFTDTTTIYATWSQVYHTLTINPNGGTHDGHSESYTKSIAEGSQFTIAYPERSEYYFDSWELSGSVSHAGDNIYIMGTSDATLTATWGYRIELIDSHGDNLMTWNTKDGYVEDMQDISLYFTEDEGPTSLKDTIYLGDNNTKYYPEKEGFIFTGWYRDPDCTTPFEQNDTVNKNTDMYAGWAQIEADGIELVEGDPQYDRSMGTHDDIERHSEFSMIGLQVRTFGQSYNTDGTIIPNSDNGLRFCIRISDGLIDRLNENSADASKTNYGFVLVRKEMLDEYNGAEGCNVMISHNQEITQSGGKPKKQASERDFLVADNYKIYTCVVVGYDSSNEEQFVSRMQSDLACRPYIEYVDANGTTRTYYQTDEFFYAEPDKTIGGAYYNNLAFISDHVLRLSEEKWKVKKKIFELYVQPYWNYVDPGMGVIDMLWEDYVSSGLEIPLP